VLTNFCRCANKPPTVPWGEKKLTNKLKKEEMAMKRIFIYFLCLSFLLMVNGFPRIVAEARGEVTPLGEMISNGEVRFEAKENVWKDVNPSYFPIFKGMKIKTEKGQAIITLSNGSQIEIGPQSLISFDQNDQINLNQGDIGFRIPPTSETNFKIGSLSFIRSKVLQATKAPSVVTPENKETIGSITIHSNGSATVRSIQGRLSLLNQDRVVLAELSPKDSLTIPSLTIKRNAPVMMAQVGETKASEEKWEFWGIGTWGWVGIGAAAAAVIAGVAIAASSGGGGGGGGCP
jgi:hypothetical protein